MVVIRLARIGSKHAPKYRITVADQRFAATGRYLEVIGTYNPLPKGKDKENPLIIDKEKYDAWVSKGAQPTQRVQSLYKSLN